MDLFFRTYFISIPSWYTCVNFDVSASKIRYEITRGNLGGAFAVKNTTGAIYVARPLDYERRKRVSRDLDELQN